MVAVLVEYIRSLNQFEIEVEVSFKILFNYSYYIFEYPFLKLNTLKIRDKKNNIFTDLRLFLSM